MHCLDAALIFTDSKRVETKKTSIYLFSLLDRYFMSLLLYLIRKIEMGTYSHFFRTQTRYLIFSMGNLSNLVHIRFFKDYMNIMSICKLTTWNWIEKFDTYLKLQSLKKVHLYYYFYYLQFLFFILKILYCKQCINGCFKRKIQIKNDYIYEP